MENIFSSFGLTKKFKNQIAVNGVNMSINKGDIYGFVGENGSGKTTVIRLITGLIFPTEGGFELFGERNNSKNIGKARSRIGAIVESPSIYLNMSAYDNLRSQCILLGAKEDKILDALKSVGLEELYNEKKHAGDFSLGMRQRLGIAMALLSEPELLILDEPMNGLDPAGIVEIRELIIRLNKEKGISFLISSHILSELSLVASKYGIISKGRLIKEITAEELHRACAKTIEISADKKDELIDAVKTALPQNSIEVNESGICIFGEAELNPLLKAILEKDIKILSVNCNDTGIEEYYLSLIGGGSDA